MEAHALAPRRIALRVFACDPGLACRIQKILCAQDVGLQEKLRVLNATIHMALGRKIHHTVECILGEQAVGQCPIANVALHEKAALAVNVVGYRA